MWIENIYLQIYLFIYLFYFFKFTIVTILSKQQGATYTGQQSSFKSAVTTWETENYVENVGNAMKYFIDMLYDMNVQHVIVGLLLNRNWVLPKRGLTVYQYNIFKFIYLFIYFIFLNLPL
jgi:hypothetical protein